MLKKIAIFLFVLLIFQMVMFARLYAADLVNQAEKITTQLTGNKPAVAGSDEDINAYLENLGIETSVDEAELNKKYHGTQLLTDPVNGNATIEFFNPEANSYKLEIYDVSKGLVASFVNINSSEVVIDKELFAAGAYIYKLEGEENLFCGTFVLR
jgi:hypothetical protein